MGCDGGTVPKRHELVREKAKEQLPDSRQVLLATWYYCALSKLPLREPIVADAGGRLYNRDAVLEYLLDKSSYGDCDKVCPHITSLKDVTTLAPAANPGWTEETGDLTHPSPTARFVCPVTLKEMNGRQRFVYIRTCGCVLSDQAIREVTGAAECLKCNGPFDPQRDVVPINPPKEESKRLLEAFEQQRKASARAARKERRKGKEEAAAAADGGPGGPAKKKRKSDRGEEAEGGGGAAPQKNTAAEKPPAPAPAPPADPQGSAALSKAASIIQAYEKEKKALGVTQSAAVRSLFTSSTRPEDRKSSGNFFNRGTIRQIM